MEWKQLTQNAVFITAELYFEELLILVYTVLKIYKGIELKN